MKKLILLIATLLIGIVIQAQVEVKGIKLGSKYEGKKKIETTLGGYKGKLSIQMNDSIRVKALVFSSFNNTDVNFKTLVGAIESKYGIKLETFEKNDYDLSSSFSIRAIKNDVVFSIDGDGSETADSQPHFIFMVIDYKGSEMRKAIKQEEQEELIKDL